MNAGTCEFCGATLTDHEQDICTACLNEQRAEWDRPIQPANSVNPGEEAEIMIALYMLKNRELYPNEGVEWARGVLARYGVI